VTNSIQPIGPSTSQSITGNWIIPPTTTTTPTVYHFYRSAEEELAAALDRIAQKYKKSEKETTIQLTVESVTQKYTVFICVGGYDE
jgi:hypothetical protein